MFTLTKLHNFASGITIASAQMSAITTDCRAHDQTPQISDARGFFTGKKNRFFTGKKPLASLQNYMSVCC